MMSFALVAMAFGSCQLEERGAAVDEEVDFTVTAGIPGVLSTYTSGEGGVSNVDRSVYDQRYILEVYDGEEVVYREAKTVEVDEPATFDVRLLAKEYRFAFWADFTENGQTSDNLYDTSSGLDEVKISSDRKAGNEYADAYCEVRVFNLSEVGLSEQVTLKRPFGKIRLVSTDAAENMVGAPAMTKVTYAGGLKVPSGYNVLSGEVLADEIEAGSYQFEPYEEEVTVGGESKGKLYILGVDYVFASDGSPAYSFDVQVDDYGVRNVTNIPVHKNKLTTVIGNFYTNEGSLDVMVEDEFDEPEIYINQALLDAAKNGGEVTLDQDCIFTSDMPALVVSPGKTLTVNLNGKTIESQVLNQDAIRVDGGTLIINGEGEIKATADGSNYAVWATGNSKVELNGGTYFGRGACIQAKDNAEIEINGGYYRVAAPYNGVYFVINLQDNQPNKIIVKGGSFENCDPAKTGTEPTGVDDNFLADGYYSSKVSDDPAVYEVFRMHYVESETEFSSAINEVAEKGGAIIVNEGTELKLSGIESLVFEKPASITVDGKITSEEESFKIENRSTLTLDGKGEVNIKRNFIQNYGNLVVNGGTWNADFIGGGTVFANYDENAVMTLNDVNVSSYNFAVAGNGRIDITGGTIKSYSSNKYGAWAYCVRASGGGSMTIRDAVVEGVQGGVASIEGAHVILENVSIYARNSEPGRQDAFYSLYAASLGVIEVISGEFYSDRIPCCYASDDDITGNPYGVFILKGGKYSSMPKNHDGSDWWAEDGYKFVETEDTTFPYEIVKE